MTTVLTDIVNGIVAGLVGPMSFRFLLQPAVATLLGIRDGRLDAKAGTRPFIDDLLFRSSDRSKALRSAVRALAMPVAFGTLFDGVAQYLIFMHVRPGAAMLVGTVVMALPYVSARAVSNRIETAAMRRREANGHFRRSPIDVRS